MSTYTKSLGAVAVLKCIAMESAKNGTSVLPKDVVAAHDAIAELIEAARKLHIVTAGIRPDIDANERKTLGVALARVQGGVK